MAGDTEPFSPNNVVGLAARALQANGSSEVSLKTPYEAVALIGHACMIAAGFRLVGLDEEHSIEGRPEGPSLPTEWNNKATLSFRYAHSQSSMQYLLKVDRLGNNVVVFALALGDDRTTTFDLPVKDWISASALPLRSTADLTNSLKDVFISDARLRDLIATFRTQVIQKLAPGLGKEGQETSTRTTERQPERAPQRDPLRDDTLPPPAARPYPFNDPLAVVPSRRPVPPGDFPPPGFEDEFEIQRPARGYPPGFGGRNPLNLGERDLYPAGLGPHDPIRGGIGPGLGGVGGGGGMHPTFDDPLFGGPRGGGYDPQAPPGARYDPVGPGQGAPFGRGRGPYGGQGSGGGFGGFGGFGGDII